MTQTRPTIRLKPKMNAQNLRFGFPWAYDNELVTDRRTKALAPGTIAELQDSEKRPLGTVTVNPGSRIFARVLDQDPAAEINADWIKAKIAAAHAHRRALFDAPFYRLIHAEADGMPGVIIDRFGDTAVLQPNAVWADARAEMIAEALVSEAGVSHVILNASGRTRALEGLGDEGRVLIGTPPAKVDVEMNGATYVADLEGGQKTGLFYDQRPNHAFAARLAQGADVLDVFSHVGGFSLAALAGGATSALAVDGSEPALELAREGAAKMGKEAAFDTRKGDAFAVMEALADEGRMFDVVICDPPAFAPNKKALGGGLRAYERVARMGLSLVKPGGYLGVCSCSHAADLDKFRTASIRGIGKAGGRAQLIHTGFAGPDHPLHTSLAESGYLKALFFRRLS